jgi:dTDP-4-amino-4,6-dideoxygalactose transaminase
VSDEGLLESSGEMIETRSKRITCNPLPTIGEDELRLLISLLSSDNMLEGKEAEAFEKMLSRYLGAKHCVSFGRGRVALYAILKAIGIGAKDEVILPAYTCFVVPNAVHFCESRPVYVDIDPLTFNIDVEKVKEKMTPQTKAIIPHHLFGQPADMKPLCELAEKAGVPVVEDCAQSLGAAYNGRKVGTIGDVAFFSFDYSKCITTGQGGMAVTNSCEIAEKLRAIRDGFPFPPKTYVYSTVLTLIRGTYLLEPSSSLTRTLIGEIVHKYVTVASDFRYFIHEKAQSTMPSSHAFCMPNALAKIGVFQLQRLNSFNEERREIARRYNELLEGLGVSAVQEIPNIDHVFLRYALSTKSGQEFRRFLRHYQIVPGNWFDYVVHPYPVQRETLGYQAGSCPVAENAATTVVNIPNHPKMNDEDVEHVGRILRLYYRRT